MIDTAATTQTVIEQLEDQPNLLMGLIGGGIAMLASAIVWGAVMYFTEYQIGWMAIGVGFLVGIAIRFFGRGKTLIFGVSGAIRSLIGCLLGYLMFYSGSGTRRRRTLLEDIFLPST